MILDIIIQEENMQTKHYLTLSDADFLLNKAHQMQLIMLLMSALPSLMKRAIYWQ